MEAVDVFAKRVRARMVELKLTQVELAKRLGVAQPTIARTLTQRITPRSDTLMRWAAALETTPQWLLGTEDDSPEPLPPREPDEVDVILFILKGMKLDPKRRRVIELALVADDLALSQSLTVLGGSIDDEAKISRRFRV